MADDTRQSDPPPTEETPEPVVRRPRRPKPKHDFPKTQAGKIWDAFYNPDEPVNTMPGGMVNSAGGRPPEVTWRDAFRFKREGGPSFYQAPCSRDALLVGIGAGGAVGGIRFIAVGLKSTLATTNWAVGAFAASALGMYQWCDMRRREEAKGMAMAVAGMKMLNDKKARERAAEEAVEQTALESQKNKRWYRFW